MEALFALKGCIYKNKLANNFVWDSSEPTYLDLGEPEAEVATLANSGSSSSELRRMRPASSVQLF